MATKRITDFTTAGTVDGTEEVPVWQSGATRKVTVANMTAALLAAGPSGTAGGDLAGTYPNPSIGSEVITDDNIAADAAIDPSKIDLTGIQSSIDRAFIPAASFSLAFGTPTPGIGTWSFADAATSTISGFFMIPPHWLTMKVSAGFRGVSGSGDVVFRADFQAVGDGDTYNPPTGSNVTITMPATNVVKVAQLIASATCTASKFQYLGISRFGANGSDTYASSASLLGILCERVT